MQFALLAKSEVLRIHEEQIEEHGGLVGVRDDGLLESALARAENLLFYGSRDVTINDVAASLAFGLAQNHPFLDGNKRTSLVVCLTTLQLNGITIDVASVELLATWQSLAAGLITEEALSIWLRDRSALVSE